MAQNGLPWCFVSVRGVDVEITTQFVEQGNLHCPSWSDLQAISRQLLNRRCNVRSNVRRF